MTDRFNTIAGWALAAGIVALGASIVVGEVFHHEKGGCEVVEAGYCPDELMTLAGGEGGAEAEKPFAFYMSQGDAAKGEKVFAKCTACHNAAQGGANGLGPNLYGVIGSQIANHAGFNYSPALAGVGGSWNFDNMSEWLKSPRNFAPGTKMTFAGLGKPEDRADVIAYMNAQGSNLPLPEAPAEEAPAEDEGDAVKAEDSGEGVADMPVEVQDANAAGDDLAVAER